MRGNKGDYYEEDYGGGYGRRDGIGLDGVRSEGNGPDGYVR